MINSVLGVLGCLVRIISSLGNLIYGSACGLTVYEFPQLAVISIRPQLT